jgi:hypothetical protein
MPLLGFILLASLPFSAAAGEEPHGAAYQMPGDVYREVGELPTIHHDASNSGVLPDGMRPLERPDGDLSGIRPALLRGSPTAGPPS